MGATNSAFLRTREYAGVRVALDKTGRNPKPYVPVAMPANPPEIDSMMIRLPSAKQTMIMDQAIRKAEMGQADVQFKIEAMKDDLSTMRRHQIELMKKFTLSVACLLFFFIGAPLGAIIRKGGLGTPLVISVFIFIIYYIIDNSGYKMARDGKWPVWEGMWISTFVLTPTGIYVTWKAMNDSAVFNPDAWRAVFNRITGRTLTRKIDFKEVIINDIDPAQAREKVARVLADTNSLLARYKRPQLYFTYWLRGMDEARISALGREMDDTAEYLTDCREKAVVNKLLDLPVVRSQWVYRPARAMWQSVLAFCLFPLSLPIWLIGMLRQRKLLSTLRQTQATASALLELLPLPESPSENTLD